MFGIGIGKYVAIGIGYLILITALMFQAQRIKTKDAQIATLLQQVQTCVETNQSNKKTVAQLRNAMEKVVKGYETRLNAQNKTIRELDRIYKLEAPKEGANDKEGVDNTNDPIVRMLDELWIDKTLADADGDDSMSGSSDTGETPIPSGQPMGCH